MCQWQDFSWLVDHPKSLLQIGFSECMSFVDSPVLQQCLTSYLQTVKTLTTSEYTIIKQLLINTQQPIAMMLILKNPGMRVHRASVYRVLIQAMKKRKDTPSDSSPQAALVYARDDTVDNNDNEGLAPEPEGICEPMRTTEI